MADRGGGPRELVFCHACENEWYRNQPCEPLQCPQCTSEIVEIIEPGDDPRGPDNGQHEQSSTETSQPPYPQNPDHEDALPHHPLHTHNPWADEAPDPDEGDIDHVQWHGPGGMHFTRISVRSGPGRRVGSPVDPFGALFSTLLNGPPNMRGGAGPRDRQTAGNPFSPPPGFGNGLRSPLQEGPGRQGFMGTYSTTTRLFPRDADNAQPQEMPVDDLHGIFSSILQGLHGTMVRDAEGHPTANMSPLAIIHSMLNPANARAGDAVYTQEALDRVISQLMEQHSTSTAPGPAAESAIAALPKTKLDVSQLDSNGKAECSICMDNLSVGDEVTQLPCKHWFHGECVSAWLREHDTCPQCRRGIMPKDGDGRAPRSPGQVPRNMQNPWAPGFFGSLGGGGASGPTTPTGDNGSSSSRPHGYSAGSRNAPPSASDSGAAGPSSSSARPAASRRTSNQSRESGQGQGQGRTAGGGGGGITGWMGRHFGGGGGH